MSSIHARIPADLAATVRKETNWSLNHRLRHGAQSVLARAYPRVFGMTREPSWLFFDLVFPILGMCSIVFLLRSRGVDEAWIGSTILATALLSFWISVVWMMGAQFHWERDSGNLLLYITAPVGLGSIALGMAIGGALGVVVRAVTRPLHVAARCQPPGDLARRQVPDGESLREQRLHRRIGGLEAEHGRDALVDRSAAEQPQPAVSVEDAHDDVSRPGRVADGVLDDDAFETKVRTPHLLDQFRIVASFHPDARRSRRPGPLAGDGDRSRCRSLVADDSL